MRRRCCGRCNKKNGSTEFCRSKKRRRFPTAIFLLPLHSLFRSRDTSSVSLTLDTFTPELRPSDALGVQAPPRGRLTRSVAFCFFSSHVTTVPSFGCSKQNPCSERLPPGGDCKKCRFRCVIPARTKACGTRSFSRRFIITASFCCCDQNRAANGFPSQGKPAAVRPVDEVSLSKQSQ